MIQIPATYHYQLLILDNLRKPPLTVSPLIKTSQSQMSLNKAHAMCMCLSLFRNHQQIKSHDPESAIETTSEHSSSTSSSYIFNVPEPKTRNKLAPAQAKSSTTSDSIFTSECTTDPDLKCQLKETKKRLTQLKSQLLQAKDRIYHPEM